MLTEKQLKDATKCEQKAMCHTCAMANGQGTADCTMRTARTALTYREMLERARKTLQDAWEDEGSTTVGKQILETIKAIDELLKGE